MKSFDSLIGSAARAAMRSDARIRELISGIVPEKAVEHILFCRHANNQLHVTIDSAAWIPRLRYSERKLLAALILDGMPTRHIRWHVTPAANPSGRQTSKRQADGGSAGSRRAVLAAARAVEGDVESPADTTLDAETATRALATADADTSPLHSDDKDALARQLRRMAENLRRQS